MRSLILTFVALMSLASCAVLQQRRCARCTPQYVTVHDTLASTVTKHDTAVVVQADNSDFAAYLQCADKTYPVIDTSNIQRVPGRVVEAPRVRMLPRGQLQVQCVVDSQAVAISYNSTHTEHYKLVTQPPEIVQVPAKINGFLKFLGISGISLWLILIIAGIYYGAKFIMKIRTG